MKRSRKTVSIHWFSASWLVGSGDKTIVEQKRKQRIDILLHLPNRIVKKIIGEKKYEGLKSKIKNKE